MSSHYREKRAAGAFDADEKTAAKGAEKAQTAWEDRLEKEREGEVPEGGTAVPVGGQPS